MEVLGKGLMTVGASTQVLGFFVHQEDLDFIGADYGLWIILAGWLLIVVGLLFTTLGRGRPRVILNGDTPFHPDPVTFYGVVGGKQQAFPAGVLSMRLINKNRRWRRSAIAERVSAHFRCEGPGTDDLPWLDARWSDTAQPHNLQANEVPQLTVDLEINSGRQINLVAKEDDSAYCYLFNNDSFGYPRGQNPNWKMGPGRYRVVVEVSGVNVHEFFECIFDNPGEGKTFKVHSYSAISRRKAKRVERPEQPAIYDP